MGRAIRKKVEGGGDGRGDVGREEEEGEKNRLNLKVNYGND